MTIYQHERWATGPLTYTLTGLTPNAAYTIAFHAAEVYYTAAGQRVMNVSCNGTTVITGFDIFASAGGQNKAVVRSVTTSTDGTGTITIVFTCTSSGNDPKICGIEVLGNVTPNNAPTQLQIQASSTYVTLAWNAPLVPTGTVTGYTVYQNGVKLTATPITTTSYRPGQDSSALTPLTSYTFVVKTVINGVESTGSVSGQATTTAATTGGVTYPLQIAANGHSLQDAGGKPFLTVAETSWTMLTKLSVNDAKWIIDKRKSQGYNTIMTDIEAFNPGSSGPRGGAFVGGDITNWNEAYFNRGRCHHKLRSHARRPYYAQRHLAIKLLWIQRREYGHNTVDKRHVYVWH